jgi:SAM-dependent methyltransferase
MDLLEIGCSTGFMLDHFQQKGLNVKGIELSEKFVPFLEERGYEIYPSIDNLAVESPKKKFDIITHFFLFEHIRDPFDFLKKSYALLKKDGWIIMEVPSATDPLTSLYDIPAFEKFYWSIAHPFYYRPKTIEFILEKLAFTYKIIPEQRYDISNHIIWMTKGKPGGQGKFSHIFSEELNYKYMTELKSLWMCDTMFVYIQNK